MPTRTVRRVSNPTALSPGPARAAHVASQDALRAPRSAVLAPASLRQCLGQAQPDIAGGADAPIKATREQALATVAAWRRADTWREATAPVPAWALAPQATPVGAISGVDHVRLETHEADEAEERGLALSMGGLMAGGLLASLLGDSTALGCALGLIVGAGLGWPLPLTALTRGLGLVRRV